MEPSLAHKTVKREVINKPDALFAGHVFVKNADLTWVAIITFPINQFDSRIVSVR